MKRMFLSAAAVALLAVGQGRVHAGSVYDNGPINGTIDASSVSQPYAVTNSFTISKHSILVGAQVGLAVFPGDTPLRVDWEIGTSPFASDIRFGTSGLSNTFFGQGYGFAPLYESSFALNATLDPGTYWLTLLNCVTAQSSTLFWDENDGPSTAFQSLQGGAGAIIGSESFQLIGLPEPSSLVLGMLASLIGLAYAWRRRKQAV